MSIVLNRIILRRPEPSDVEALYEMKNDWENARLLGGFSNGYSREDLCDWIERHRNRVDEIIWIIANKKDNKCIGHVGLYNIDHRVRSAEFAILIGNRQYRSKGLGKEIARAVIEQGFKQLNLHRIELSVITSNNRAISFYKMMGFQAEGTLRHSQFRDGQYLDMTIMSILEGEWEVKNTFGK